MLSGYVKFCISERSASSGAGKNLLRRISTFPLNVVASLSPTRSDGNCGMGLGRCLAVRAHLASLHIPLTVVDASWIIRLLWMVLAMRTALFFSLTSSLYSSVSGASLRGLLALFMASEHSADHQVLAYSDGFDHGTALLIASWYALMMSSTFLSICSMVCSVSSPEILCLPGDA